MMLDSFLLFGVFLVAVAATAASAETPVCLHRLRARARASSRASSLLQWDPLPVSARSRCREIELQVFAADAAEPNRLSLSGVEHLGCDTAGHRLSRLRPSGQYRVTLSVLREPSGLYCRRSETVAFRMENFTTAAPLNGANSTSTSASSAYAPPRWTVADALIFLLVLAAWAAAVALFLHKLGSLRISRGSRGSARHLRPNNLDKVQVCAESSRTVIYSEHARGSRMSVCLEERQARLAHLQRRYAQERELEAIDERQPPPQRHQQTLDAISLRRLPTYAVAAGGGVNLQVLPAGLAKTPRLLHPASAAAASGSSANSAAAAASAAIAAAAAAATGDSAAATSSEGPSVCIISSGKLPGAAAVAPPQPPTPPSAPLPTQQRTKAPLVRQFSESAVSSNGAGGSESLARLTSLGSSTKSETDAAVTSL